MAYDFLCCYNQRLTFLASQFLYRCTTGLIDKNANGCIMADGMGLGKTVCRRKQTLHGKPLD
jgi:hypothetical protein